MGCLGKVVKAWCLLVIFCFLLAWMPLLAFSLGGLYLVNQRGAVAKTTGFVFVVIALFLMAGMVI